MSDTSWWVLHVNANHEKRVMQHLTARSVDCYLPLYSERRRWTDRNMVIEKPLFPGYVFTRFAAQHRTLALSTPGVFRALGDADHHRVRAEEIEKIQAGLAAGLSLHPHIGIPVGTRVRVCEGIFAGALGVVKEFRQSCRVMLSIAGVQQFFSLEVQLEDIEVVKEPFVQPTQAHGWQMAC